MRQSKILQFPNHGPVNDTALKCFAVLFYTFLAYMLTWGSQFSEEGLWVLIGLQMLYSFFFMQRIHKMAEFQRNRWILLVPVLLFFFFFGFKALYFVALGGIYWLLVGRTGREAPYFLKFHLLTGLILFILLWLPFAMLASSLRLVVSLLALLKLQAVTILLTTIAASSIPWAMLVIFWGFALWLSVSALMGRTPYIALVTRNVRELV